MRTHPILDQIAQRMEGYKDSTGHIAKHIYLGRLQQKQFDKALGSPEIECEEGSDDGVIRQKFRGAVVHELVDEEDHLAVS